MIDTMVQYFVNVHKINGTVVVSDAKIGLVLSDVGLDDPGSEIVAICKVSTPYLYAHTGELTQDYLIEWRGDTYRCTMSIEPNKWYSNRSLFFTGELTKII